MKKLREEFADLMLSVGDINSELVVLVGDISHGILQPFAKKFPDRYYNVGICEPTIVNMSAGLSKVGLIPVVHTIAPFIIERAYEQIKLDFGYQNLPLNLISVGGAYDYTQLGCSHHCYADVSLMCHIENSCVMMPGSAKEFNKLFLDNYKNGCINYFKLTEFPHSIELKDDQIKLGKGIKIADGKDVTILTVGGILQNAIDARELLIKDNISAEIIYFNTVKPFDNEIVVKSTEKTKRLLTLEELSEHDGLHNLALKALSGKMDFPIKQMAIKGFVSGYGTYKEMQDRAGLSINKIVKKVNEICGEK